MKDIILLLDNQDEVTLEDFIEANTSEDVVPLDNVEITALKALKMGDSIQVGMADVKRIK